MVAKKTSREEILELEQIAPLFVDIKPSTIECDDKDEWLNLIVNDVKNIAIK